MAYNILVEVVKHIWNPRLKGVWKLYRHGMTALYNKEIKSK